MDDDDFRDEIAQLEARSEALTESIERCRKISLAAKLTIAAGAIWIVLVLLGVIAFSPGTIIAAMAAVLGGIVLLGSNATTWTQTDAALVSNPHMFKTLPYDPVKDFVAVSMVAKNPFLILANANLPANNLPELIAYDKANPGNLAFATDGRRNFSGILATWLNKVSGADILQVPYATMPQGVQDTLAGRTQLTILAIPSAAPHIASGALKPIAISWTKRLPQYAQVPSISEAYPGVELTGWFVIAAPAGTPAEVITLS